MAAVPIRFVPALSFTLFFFFWCGHSNYSFYSNVARCDMHQCIIWIERNLWNSILAWIGTMDGWMAWKLRCRMHSQSSVHPLKWTPLVCISIEKFNIHSNVSNDWMWTDIQYTNTSIWKPCWLYGMNDYCCSYYYRYHCV